MPAPVALVVVDDIARAYDFGASHPLRPERVLLTYENITRLGLDQAPHVSKIPAAPATDEDILRVHAPEYVEMVQAVDAGRADRSDAAAFGLGTMDNPIFEGMHPASAAVCGASLAAARAVARGDVAYAFNPAGGLHHARRREASGFCIYDDPAVAIAGLLEMQPSWRVMYVDVDVHHGDGVQWIFYDDPRVLTVSLHQTGRTLYPGTGFEDEIGSGDAAGTSVNIPLEPFTGEEDYLWALERVLTAAAGAFRPDVIVTQLGADTHHGDPLANLALTMPAFPRMARVLHDVARHHCADRWVATGGGGYQAETVVPKVWTIHFAEMCGMPEVIPAGWLTDQGHDIVARSFRTTIERSVEQVLDACLPRLEALAS